MVTPCSSTGRVVVRASPCTGETYRSSSSTALGHRPGSAARRRRASGSWASVTTPCVIMFIVVFWAASCRSEQKPPISASESSSPGGWVLTICEIRSVPAPPRRPATMPPPDHPISPDPAAPGPGPLRFVGLLDGLCQWVLVRPAGVSVTVSAGDAAAGEDQAALAPRAWAELRRAALGFGLAGDWPEAPPPCRVVKERRATPRHTPGPALRPPRLPLANLALAGDWTEPSLPATIEAAVLSGLAAARALRKT